MIIHSDPSQAIDLSKPCEMNVFAKFGWFGPYPSRPCDVCGSDDFHSTDWGLGYKCENGHTFGTEDEWAWERGTYRA